MKTINKIILICIILSCPVLCIADSDVRIYRGIPTLFINDQPCNGNSLFVYNVEGTYSYEDAQWLPTFKSYIKKAKECGVTYLGFWFTFSLLGGSPQEPVTYGDEYDFSKMDSLFDYAFSQGVYILPAINADNPPLWWITTNTNNLQTSYDGLIDARASFHNPEYWDVADAYLSVIVNHYKNHPALLGWDIRIGVTAENNYGPSYIRDIENPPESWCDYSTHALNNFQDWLKTKYVTDANLRAAWNDPSMTFDLVEIPFPEADTTIVFPNTIEEANGPGETRPDMLDWLSFRLEEKRIEYEHFIGLIDQLDPDHVMAIDPASSVNQAIVTMTPHGMNDYIDLVRNPLADIVVRHPRISVDETRGPFNSTTKVLKMVVQNEVRLEKLVTFAMEDLGEKNTGIDSVDSIDRLETLTREISALGGNMGLVIGQVNSAAEYGLPRWGDNELDYFGQRNYLFNPETRPIPMESEYAILMDFIGEMPMYRFDIVEYAPSADRIILLEHLYEKRMAPDVISVDEIKDNPAMLSQYKGILLIHLSYIDTIAAQILHDYEQKSGKLFIGGRTGLFDKVGQFYPTSFCKLTGIPNAIQFEQKSVKEIWFGESDHPAIWNLENTQLDNNNTFYSLFCDWSSQGYQVLGYGKDVANNTYPSILSKGNIIIWFPRIGCSQTTERNLFFDNLFSGWGIPITSVEESDQEQPSSIMLLKNYPNPFNATTTLCFSIPYTDHTILKVFDILGREVAILVDEVKKAGMHKILFDASHLGSGVYFYQVKTGNAVQQRKMMVIK